MLPWKDPQSSFFSDQASRKIFSGGGDNEYCIPVLAPVEADADEEDAVDGQQDSTRDHTHRQQPAGGATV